MVVRRCVHRETSPLWFDALAAIERGSLGLPASSFTFPSFLYVVSHEVSYTVF